MPLPTRFCCDSRVDRDVVSRFATCCRALGLSVHDRRRPPDLAAARSGFAELDPHRPRPVRRVDRPGRRGRYESPRVIEAVWQTVEYRRCAAAPDRPRRRRSGVRLRHRAVPAVRGVDDRDDFQLAYAVTLCDCRRLRGRGPAGRSAHRPPAELARGALGAGGHVLPDRALVGRGAAAHPDRQRFERWTRRTPTPRASRWASRWPGWACSPRRCRTWRTRRARSTSPPSTAHWPRRCHCGRRVRTLDAADVLPELYAANPENEEVETALSDTSYGIVPTTAARIEARSNPWDPDTEPTETDFVDPGAKERKAHLLIEAEAELAEFIGLEEVKYQVARLKSSVAMAIRRQERGLTVANRTNHLVFAGPPGTGKTTIARVVAKIYCGLGILKKETVREVHRADLIGQHIGETEAKTNAHHRQRAGRRAVPRRGLRAGVDRREERLRPRRHRHAAGPHGERPRAAGRHRRGLPQGPRRVPRHQRGPAVALHPQHRLPVVLAAGTRRDRDADGREARQRLRAGGPRTTWSRCSVSSPPSPRPTPTASSGAASTSPATAGSSATSSNAPRRSASTGSTIPTPRISPMTS